MTNTIEQKEEKPKKNRSLGDRVAEAGIIASATAIVGTNIYSGILNKQEFTQKLLPFELTLAVGFGVLWALCYGKVWLENKLDDYKFKKMERKYTDNGEK